MGEGAESSDRDAPAFFYGWVVLGVSTVAMVATSPGQSYLVGKFNAEIEAALGIPETTLTAAYGVATFVAAIALLAVGRLGDRFGPRVVMGVAALALGGACWCIGFATGPVSLAVCYFLIRFSGQGALGLSSSHSVAMWFERRLGTATGIKSFAMPVAIFVLPLITTWLIAEFGWRRAYGLLGVGVWVSVLPLVVLLHRNRPEDLGQRVDGDPPDDPEPDVHPHAQPDAELIASAATEQPLPIDLVDDEDAAPAPRNGEVCFTRAQAMRTLAFWLVTVAMVANALIGTAFVFLLGKLAGDVGFAQGADNRLLGVFAVGSAVFSPIAGVLTDRLAARWLVSSASALLGLTCAAFALAGLVGGGGAAVALAWAAMLFLAASQSVMFVSGSTIFARFYGRPHHGDIRASLGFFMIAGTSAGPFLTAALAQGLGYGGALWVFAAACVPIAMAGLMLRRPVSPGSS